jgi:large subunit ribosomal protein L30
MIMAKIKKLKVTQLKSKFGRLKSHKACVDGLGLKRIHHTVMVLDTPENRGMINRISYMVLVEEI